MKRLLFIFMCLTALSSNAQTWNSYATQANWGFYTVGKTQFKIDPYRNDLWIAHWQFTPTHCFHLATGERDSVYSETLCNDECTKDLAFTSTNRYIMYEFTGLYDINADYSVTNELNLSFVDRISSNEDTVYIISETNSNYYKFTENQTQLMSFDFDRIVAKGVWFYPCGTNNTSIKKYTGIGGNGFQNYASVDSDHTCGLFNDIKFSPYSDSLYVSCASGINIAYAYDFIYNINPSNTLNMPTANVLEFEFDKENNIWALFGDTNNNPYAFAKLEGNTWTNYFDATNCPVDFSKFKGFEIDTNGVIWVLERNYLRTLSFGNNPVWLNAEELDKNAISLFPNPVKNNFSISINTKSTFDVQIFTLSGALVKTIVTNSGEPINVNEISNGFYLVKVKHDGKEFIEKLIKE